MKTMKPTLNFIVVVDYFFNVSLVTEEQLVYYHAVRGRYLVLECSLVLIRNRMYQTSSLKERDWIVHKMLIGPFFAHGLKSV